ncbi:MAG: tetratricopeptide repeat protein [Candidatus Eremiobacteraeota bacterium]|nr:tetratricopeptide repeat protein [Candidatus Eremiobacteraeota bacterium]
MEIKFTRIALLNGSYESANVTLDYGEFSFRWIDITHAFAVKVKTFSREEPPLLILKVRGMEGFYHIDGTKINPRLFTFTAKESHDSTSRKNYVTPRTVDIFEKSFKWIAEEICSRLERAYIDRPLVECIQSSIIFLPVFSTIQDAGAYCAQIVEAMPEGSAKKAPSIEAITEDLRKVQKPSTEEEKWKEGAIIEGKYTVQQIMKGGMGIVYVVFDPEEVAFFALKTYQQRYLWNERVINQFIKEAAIWINLERHPHIVQAKLVRIVQGKPCIFLEYVQGSNLEDELKKGPLILKQALSFAMQFCDGMHYAFRKLGLIHRDIKPSNCLITRDGILKISDFGLGKIFDDNPVEGEPLVISLKDGGKKVTSSSTSMAGTLPFMAPELFTDLKSSSVKTDIYAFGIVLYMMLTGFNPFFNEDPSEVVQNHLFKEPESPDYYNTEIPHSLGEILLTCVKKNPEERFDSFFTIKERLEKVYEETFGTPYALEETEDIFSEDDWINKGISLASLGRHREAVITFDQAIIINEESIKALIMKGRSLLELKKFEEALQCFNDAMQKDPENWESWYYKGEALLALEAVEEAFNCFDFALELNPTRAEVFTSKGKVLARMGHRKRALECFNRALALFPENEELLTEKGNVLLEYQMVQEADECFSKAIEINPRFVNAWIARGEALYRLGFYQESINHYQKALTLSPQDPETNVKIGNNYRELKNYDKARASYYKALQLDRKFSGGYLGNARLLAEMTLRERALQCLKQALSEGLSDIPIMLEMARIHLSMGYFKKALSVCSQILSQDISNRDAGLISDSASYWNGEKEKIIQAITRYRPIEEKKLYGDPHTLLATFCDIDDAITHLKDKIAIKADADLWYLLARIQKMAEAYDDTCFSCEQALLLRDDFQEARNFLDVTQKENEAAKKAREDKKGFLGGLFKKEAKPPSTAGDWFVRGLRKMRRGDENQALESFQQALKFDPSMACCWLCMGKLLKTMGKNEKAEQCFSTFATMSPYSPGYYKYRILSAPQDIDPGTLEDYYHRWIGLLPQNPYSWLAYFSYLIENQKEEELYLLTIELLENFINRWTLSKKSALYWNLRGILAVYLKRHERASKFFARSLHYSASNPFAVLGTAKCDELSGKTQEALRIYKKLSEMDNAAVIGLYLSANLQIEAKNEKESTRLIEEAIKLKPASSLLTIKKAQIFVEFGNFGKFIGFYSSLYHLTHYSVLLHQLRARSLASSGKLHEALTVMKDGLASKADNIHLQKGAGALHLTAHLPEKALEYFENILSLDPLNGPGLIGKGISCYMMHRYNEALSQFEKFLVHYPLDPQIWLLLGATCFQVNDYETSESYFRKALDIQNRFTKGWSNLGIFCLKRGKFAEALHYAERALRIDTENGYAWMCRGAAYRKRGNLDEAYRSIVKALYYVPFDFYGWTQRGLIEFEQKKIAESFESLSKAGETGEKKGWAWYNLGVLSLHLKKVMGTERYFNKALSLQPDLTDAIIGRAVLFKLQGDRNASEKALQALEGKSGDIYQKWKDCLEEETVSLAGLPLMDESEIPFDLPLNFGLEFTEPLHVLHYQRLDDNF